MKGGLATAIAIGCVFFLGSVAHATTVDEPALLDPGGAVSMLPVFNGAGATTLAQQALSYNFTDGTAASLTVKVIDDGATNPYGLADIGFVYLLSVTSGAVSSVTVTNYTDIGTYVKGCDNSGCIFTGVVDEPAPSSASRTADGKFITFTYATAQTSGQSEFNTYTNTTSFVDPAITVTDADGNSLTLSGFGPIVTPIPASLPLFAGGLGALGFFGWRGRRNARALTA